MSSSTLKTWRQERRRSVKLSVLGVLGVLLTCTAAPALGQQALTLVPYESSDYRYLVVPQGSGAGFEQPAFDDSAFAIGAAPFGVGFPGCPLNNTVVTNWTPVTDILVRRSFVVPAGAHSLHIGVAIDNDVQVFVNGVDVSGGLVQHENCPTTDSFVFSVPDAILTPGTNLLAIRGRDRGSPCFLDVQVTGVGGICGNGSLDPGEQCDAGAANGSSTSCCTATCTFRAAGDVCRPTAGVCDVDDTCTGSNGLCPALDQKSTAECRAAATDCDLAESCDGAGNDCPADGFKSAGTPCTTDGIACTVDACNATATCTHTPTNALCDNGLFCDGAETCNATLGCQAGTPPNLDDGLACTVDTCNEPTDTIVHTPNNAACDNGLFCDGTETCNATLGCQPGTPPNVDDGIGCTVDSCDEATDSSLHVPNDAACDNGLFCDGAETCGPSSTTAVVPTALDTAPGNSSSNFPFNCAASHSSVRYQQAYNGPLVGSGTITALRFRLDAPGSFGPTIIPGVTIQLSTTVGFENAMSASFNDNVGGDVVTVFSGPLTLSGSCASGPVCPFNVEVPLTTPFAFNGMAGNLLVDIVLPTCPTTAPLDFSTLTGDGTGRVVGTAFVSIADILNDAGGLATQFAFLGAYGCNPGTAPNTDDGIACTADSCDEPTDSILHAPNNAACNDANVCTIDVCNPGSGCSNNAGNAGAECRAAAGVCDLAETCDGSSASCPLNAFKSSTVVCRVAAGVCDLTERCTGSGAACPADAKSTALCRSAGDQCGAAEFCNGTANTCPPDLAATDGTSCNDGDGCPADTCQAGVCQPVSCPSVDAVALAGKPLNVTIANGKGESLKTLSVKVRNADSSDRTISLSVDASDCPAAVAGDPDFDTTNTTPDPSILVPAGRTKTAKLPLTIRSTDFDSFNYKAPARCTLLLTAAAVVAGGSNDPNAANNVAVVELNVVDKNEAEETAIHETTLKSAEPLTINIGDGKTTATKTLKAAVGNADYRPSAENPGDAITLAASASCTGLTLSPPVCDSTTSSPTVTVKGGTSKTCTITATVDPLQISTPNKLSPQRCSVSLSATGPSNPETAPLEASNNATELVIDVIDKNDF